jgi:hypothetical protein
MQTADIKSTIVKIRQRQTEIKDVNVIRDEYMSFFEAYPKLFAAAVDPAFPMTFIDPMLQALNDLDNKKLNLDAADELVYGQLRKKYVDPYFPPDADAAAAADADASASAPSTSGQAAKKQRTG